MYRRDASPFNVASLNPDVSDADVSNTRHNRESDPRGDDQAFS